MTTSSLSDPYEGAICREVGGDLWYSPNPDEREQARQLCLGRRAVPGRTGAAKPCPALLACREAGKHERWGIWGGKPAGGAANMDMIHARTLERELAEAANRDRLVTFPAPRAGEAQAS